MNPTRIAQLIAASTTALLAGAANAAPPPAVIDTPPLPATVGVGDGVEFEVIAHAEPVAGNRITGYIWRHYAAVVPCGRTARCILPSVTTADAGKYTVEVQTRLGSAVSPLAYLSVVGNQWVPLGGRPLALGRLPQEPALTLCDRATVAWVSASSKGRDLRVHRYTGSGWQALGSLPLNQATSSDAAEPTIDCAEVLGTRGPAVAWSEADGPGSRVLRIRRWDGRGWVDAGVASLTGTSARRPKLRVAPPRPEVWQFAVLPTHTALAWTQDGYARVAVWDGRAWQRRGGWPVVDDQVALTLDSDWTQDRVPTDPAVVLSLDARGPGNQFAPAVRETHLGFAVNISTDLTTRQPVGPQRHVVGVGWGRDAGGAGLFAAWLDGTQPYRLRTARLPSPDYGNALLGMLPAWQSAVPDKQGQQAIATAFDPKEYSSGCGGSEPAFGMALAEPSGVHALMADCRVSFQWQWREMTPSPLAVSALQIDARMVGDRDPEPVLATVVSKGAAYELTVWRYAR